MSYTRANKTCQGKTCQGKLGRLCGAFSFFFYGDFSCNSVLLKIVPCNIIFISDFLPQRISTGILQKSTFCSPYVISLYTEVFENCVHDTLRVGIRLLMFLTFRNLNLKEPSSNQFRNLLNLFQEPRSELRNVKLVKSHFASLEYHLGSFNLKNFFLHFTGSDFFRLSFELSMNPVN